MSRRLEFHQILVDLLESTNVYFQPPSTVKMKYPCIVYGLNQIDTQYADDELYKHQKSYMVTVIDPDPDSEIPDKILRLSLCKFDKSYTADNLNHYVFNIYY